MCYGRRVAGKVLINDQIVEPEDAQISVFDRGFLYGDSIYETLRVYDGKPFALTAHLERLHASGRRIAFEVPWTDEALIDAIDRTLEAAGLISAYLRVVVTRGSGRLGLDPNLAAAPQLIVMALPLNPIPDEVYARGRRAALVSVRRNLKRAVDPQAKTGNYMNSVMAEAEARQRDADEAIMLDVEGRVAEASSANVFAWLEGQWVTPPLEVGILSGITRRVLLTLMDHHNIPHAERILWPRDLERAEEMLLCSSLREVMPVVALDGKPVGSGRPGERTARLRALYRAEVEGERT